MKKTILSLVAITIATVSMSAQDMAQATEIYNNGATSLSMGDNADALTSFEQALAMGEACGEDGAELVANCKDIIPQIHLALAKDYIKANEYDKAITHIDKAAETAAAYDNNPDVIDEAAELKPQVFLGKANEMLNNKDFNGAITEYGKIIAADSTNAIALVRLGMAYGATGKIAEAEKSYLAAARHGQEDQAYKQLSTIYIKLAANDLKAKNYSDAIAKALKSNEYKENATAFKVAGQASSQLKKNDDAIKYFEKYIELSPNAKDASAINCTIAVLAQQSGDKAKAIEFYQKLVNDPKYGVTAKQQLEVLQK